LTINGHYGILELTGKTCLIVDDICDGGGTFVLAANYLHSLGAKNIALYTTHGIYSKGTDVLSDNHISRIFNYKGETNEK
jgi:ribose-phosphate pyrophosphokinase